MLFETRLETRRDSDGYAKFLGISLLFFIIFRFSRTGGESMSRVVDLNFSCLPVLRVSLPANGNGVQRTS
jgi:hypothetical protein